MKKQKVSSFTSLKTALWMITMVFAAIGTIMHLVYHFILHKESMQVIIFFVLLFSLSLYRFCVNYKAYKSPEFQAMMTQSKNEWKQYKETRKEEKESVSLNNHYEGTMYEEPKKAHNILFWFFASIGLAIYALVGTVFKLTDYVAPINSSGRRRGRRGRRWRRGRR